MVTLLTIALLGQTPQPRRFLQPNMTRGGSAVAPAFFEFAPASGSGMTAPCACSAVTGSRGEALTFTRASSGTCLKGGTASGIANGDMVTCSTDQPRVMAGGDGSGAVGLLIEPARDNWVVWSEAFDNTTDWEDLASGVAAPVRTANAATAPDGTLTADRIQFPACTPGTYSAIYQLNGCPNPVVASFTRSVFLKGRSGSGTTTINGGSGAPLMCSFNASTWTLCIQPNVADVNAFLIGNNCSNGDTLAAADVYVWGAQCEFGADSSSYIKTGAVRIVSRAADVATFPSSIASAIADGGSIAATVLATPSIGKAIVDFDTGGGARPLYLVNGVSNVGFFDGTDDVQLALTSLTQQVPNTFSAAWRSTSMNLRNNTNGTSIGSVFAGPLSVNQFRLGASAWDVGLNGVIKGVCLDTSHNRCVGGSPPATPPVALALGDSRTASDNGDGQIAWPFWPTKSWWTDVGASGATWSQCQTQYTDNNNARYTALGLQCGVNDILAGTDGHALFASQKTWVEARAAGGRTVVWFDMPGFYGYNNTPSKLTARNDYNSDLSAYCVAPAAGVRCGAIATLLDDAINPDALAAAYDLGDHLHYLTAGHQVIGATTDSVLP